MSETTFIEWCDSTFNPWIGCTRVSPACDNCYAAHSTPARALRVAWGPHEQRHRTSVANWRQPLRWEAKAAEFFAQHGRRRRVFCASLADVFDNVVPPEWREDLFETIRLTPHLDWLLLTKRPQNIVRMVQESGAVAGNGTRFLPDNAWLGTTVEDNTRAQMNIPALLRTVKLLGARTLFLSVEPMLAQVDVFNRSTGKLLHASGEDCQSGSIDWVICGGESGPKARPMSPQWVRDLRDQCAAAGVPFLFKQWGEWLPMLGQANGIQVRDEKSSTPDGWAMGWAGKKAAGRLLDGVEHSAFPQGDLLGERIARYEHGR